MIVLELDLNVRFTILGTSIMLANAFQEQDPLSLEVNKEEVTFPPEVIERHDHYIASGSPDLRWIYLRISLNKDNPLTDNPYTPFLSVCEINSPVSCDNLILTTLVGFDEKIYVTFDMGKDELEKAIQEYYNKSSNTHEQNEITGLNQTLKRLLKKD